MIPRIICSTNIYKANKCTKMNLWQIHLVVFLFIIGSINAKLFTLEAEHFAPRSMKMPRSGASENFTVLFHHHEQIRLEFCLKRHSVVKINDMIYSNDGPSDLISVQIDDRHVGTVRTAHSENAGNGWNIFHATGSVWQSVPLQTGRHYITMNASQSDYWGVEVDYLLLDIDDHGMGYSDLVCNLYCFDHINYEEVARKDSIPSGLFVQKSRSTMCTEQDNVNIPVYHETATDFEIVTHLPKYVSFANNRNPQYENCVLGSPFWSFGNMSVSPETKPESTDTDANLTFTESNTRTVLVVTFSLRKLTPTREVDESVIGTVLRMRLRNLSRENVMVKPEYLKKGSWIGLNEIEFTPFKSEHVWNIPERTWDIAVGNMIRLYIDQGEQRVILDTLRLDRLDNPDSLFDIYADSEVVYQGVRLGFWHHRIHNPNSMTVEIFNGDNKASYKKVDSIRVYRHVPWSGGYSQIFVLFQNGRVRLQSITPHGLDYVPFGSSVHIGQPLIVNSSRPYAPIKRVTIHPSVNLLAVDYADGNSAQFHISSTFTETRLRVKRMLFKQSRRIFPVMTFMSMWVSDGNSDVDHVTINGGISRDIMTDWNQLHGISAVFFRKCISSHNTQAPDLKIQFLAPTDN